MTSNDEWIYTGLKPLSANERTTVVRGRKVPTSKFTRYKDHLLRVLPDIDIPEPPMTLSMEVHYSSKLADLDNAIKPFQDCLQYRYKFDDKHIYEIRAVKKIVKRGQETIKFSLRPFNDSEERQEVPTNQS